MVPGHATAKEAGVPENVVFRTKPELGLEMIRRAVDEQVPFQWVGGDSVDGDSPTFVQGVHELGKWYVLDVSSEARVWVHQPEVGKLVRVVDVRSQRRNRSLSPRRLPMLTIGFPAYHGFGRQPRFDCV